MPTRYIPLVECYSRGARLRLHAMLDLCNTLHHYVCGVEVKQDGYAVSCCCPANSSCNFSVRSHINSHQKRISKATLTAFEQKMATLNFSRLFNDFDDLFDYVANNSGLRNKYCLLVYDFCLRMGHHMSPKLEPNEYVYLFCGARQGAEAVLGKLKTNVYRLPTAFLQDALSAHSLTSMEIEDFLCVCKSHLRRIGPLSQTTISNLCNTHNIIYNNTFI